MESCVELCTARGLKEFKYELGKVFRNERVTGRGGGLEETESRLDKAYNLVHIFSWDVSDLERLE
jgi:hypothetical protein